MAVANYYVDRALGERTGVTNMALQKILYFADGFYLAGRGRPLFGEKIEAWNYGPVVPEVYHEFKHHGAKPIKEQGKVLKLRGGLELWRSETPTIPRRRDTAKDRQLLDSVWEDYGHRSAVELMRESHRRGGPWAQVFRPGARHLEIPQDLMREYFSAHQ